MLSERRADTVVVRAPAKVNLFLEVLGKRADGYHEIATLMVAVCLFDTLEFKEEVSPQIFLQCDHPDLSTGPDNLICRAAERLRRCIGYERGVRIRLRKRIPMAAGLAGGSTDAAATLYGLNRLWRLGRTSDELAALGAELGSDVPFFFHTPAAWCTGRGEQVAPLTLGRPLDLVLVCPSVGLSTAEVYRGVKVPEQPLTGDEIRAAARAGDVEAIGQRLHNRLQSVAEELSPEVAALYRRLAGLASAGQLMSGSGSSLFALCRNEGEARRVDRALRRGAEEGISSSGLAGDGARRVKRFVVRSCL
jgi:4-diphosphocytidyl-2-C-methyl-D-erythritol kinase